MWMTFFVFMKRFPRVWMETAGGNYRDLIPLEMVGRNTYWQAKNGFLSNKDLVILIGVWHLTTILLGFLAAESFFFQEHSNLNEVSFRIFFIWTEDKCLFTNRLTADCDNSLCKFVPELLVKGHVFYVFSGGEITIGVILLAPFLLLSFSFREWMVSFKKGMKLV